MEREVGRELPKVLGAIDSGLSRSRLYELLAQGQIKSLCLKSHNKALRGVRLVDRESIDLFMESLRQVVSEPIN
jgi:hypothetical protein